MVLMHLLTCIKNINLQGRFSSRNHVLHCAYHINALKKCSILQKIISNKMIICYLLSIDIGMDYMRKFQILFMYICDKSTKF